MRLRFVGGFFCKIKPDTQVSVKCKPTAQKMEIIMIIFMIVGERQLRQI